MKHAEPKAVIRMLMPPLLTTILRQWDLIRQRKLTETICFCSLVPPPCHRRSSLVQSEPIVRSPNMILTATLAPMISIRLSPWRSGWIRQSTPKL